ncbi:MAG: hypothetical protein IJ635_05710 [Bacteroidaceae bacterium]|nr:hypothetical protein [Bacteroidaceae bacterium]
MSEDIGDSVDHDKNTNFGEHLGSSFFAKNKSFDYLCSTKTREPFFTFTHYLYIGGQDDERKTTQSEKIPKSDRRKVW